MRRLSLSACVLVSSVLFATSHGHAAAIVFPQTRNAYHVGEPIEIAVTELGAGASAKVEIVPAKEGVAPLAFEAVGDGGAATYRIPAFSLAPGSYTVKIDGKPQRERLTIARGVHRSTMYVSQTMRANTLAKSGGNFVLSNAFTFGLLERDGLPTTNLRRRSSGMNAQEGVVAADFPSLIYMYWTGYVLHKPWGIHKEWASADMTENMRLFNFHVAQRLRRYKGSILYVGSLDEPGLPWGKTPGGGSATGFPGWNTEDWYEARGWKYTPDPGSRPDDDWLKYMRIRCGMLGEQCAQAAKDIKTVWPDVVYSTDLYAPHAIMDGTDPWNQRCNDIPSTHVFVDWGYGKLGAMSGLYIEKAHDPTAKVAHAMNGQLFSARVPQPQTRYAYHLMLNSMLAAGLSSNWWLNYGGMKHEDLFAVNDPAQRIGPVFAEMELTGHDTAMLWSFTEIAMRCKDVTAREAKKKDGEQIKLMIADYPESNHLEDGQLVINAYNVGGNYRQQLITAHQALSRAGYPAHVVDERLLPQGILKNYRTLVIIGQTFALPAEVRKAIEAFVASGGKLVVDKTTAVKLDRAIVTDADLAHLGHRWGAAFTATEADGKTPVEKGLYQTNYWADSFARAATPKLKAAMQKTGSKPVFTTDSVFLAAERHVGGEGELHMVINAHEKLPALAEGKQHYIYNYSPYQATYTLSRVKSSRVVYLVEGLDWKKVSEVANPTAPQTLDFEPGEMKLYLVARKKPTGIRVEAGLDGGKIEVAAQLLKRRMLWPWKVRMKMPWPIEVTVYSPEGEAILSVYRAMDIEGYYQEALPLGANTPPGTYSVAITSPVANLSASVSVEVGARMVSAEKLGGAVRVFDEDAITGFLAAKPKMTIALGSASHQAIADGLAEELEARGIEAVVEPESKVWRKALYPRVWDPYIKVHKPAAEDKPLGETMVRNPKTKELEPVKEEVKLALTVESPTYNTPTLKTEDGQPLAGKWQEPGTLLKVVGSGYIALRGPESFYEAGCKLYVNANRKVVVLNGEPVETKTTPDVRQKWSRPWGRLGSFVGAHNLIPQLPEAYAVDSHLILLGDSTSGELVRALQASELLPQVVDEKYPGPGKALVSFAWSPFALEKNAILVGAIDDAGLKAGLARLLELAPTN